MTLGRIDVHHHILPPRFRRERRDEILALVTGAEIPDWTPEGSLAAMDRHGIATAVTSIGAPGAPDPALARHCNEYAAGMRRDHPGRFATFSVLPLPDVAASLAEIAYAFDELDAVGVGVLSRYDGRWLGDPAFAPVLDALHERGAVVHVQPAAAPFPGLLPDVPDPFLELPFETTRAVASLLYSGTLARSSGCTFVLAHGGGALPMLRQRLATWSQRPGGLSERMPYGALYELGRLWCDVASVADPPAWAAMAAFYGTDQILLGSGFPDAPVGAAVDGLDGLGLPDEVRRAVERENALRLLPALA